MCVQNRSSMCQYMIKKTQLIFLFFRMERIPWLGMLVNRLSEAFHAMYGTPVPTGLTWNPQWMFTGTSQVSNEIKSDVWWIIVMTSSDA